MTRAADSESADHLLDRFMPVYDVRDCHEVMVATPAAAALTAACETDLQTSPVVRAIIRAREILLGAAGRRMPPRGLLASMLSIGWGVLAEVPDREVVVGAVTRPWEPDVTFRALPPDRFAAFDEPGYVKIVWTLRADPLGLGDARLRTETRAMATDDVSRSRFRRYWFFLSPGIKLIRAAHLRQVRKAAERFCAAVDFDAAPTARDGRPRT